MDHFRTGQFSGQSNQTIRLDGLVATDLEYDFKFVDWHYHQNPYFSLITKGKCRDINKREAFDCSADTLLFHNCREPHYNTKDSGVSRAFQIEMKLDWRQKYEVDVEKLPRSAKVSDPNIKLLLYNIYKELMQADNASSLTVDALLVEAFEMLCGAVTLAATKKPKWVNKLDEILHEECDRPLSLYELSKELDLHWAHLSREFPKYFRCNFSQYLRKIKVERSFAMLRKKDLSVTEIAFICGFADQSHFIRCFKEFTGATPSNFRKALV